MRIFGTVGSHPDGFPRLVSALDRLAQQRPDLDIEIQIGNTHPPPRHARWFRFKVTSQFDEHIAAADVVVCHGGVGSIIHAITKGRPTVVVPRLPERGEVIDNHQVLTAKALSADGLISAAMSEEEILEIAAATIPPPALSLRRQSLVAAVRRATLKGVMPEEDA